MDVVMCRRPMFDMNGTCYRSAALGAQDPTTPFCALRSASEVVNQLHSLERLHNEYVNHAEQLVEC
jgi:hypothetical protein